MRAKATAPYSIVPILASQPPQEVQRHRKSSRLQQQKASTTASQIADCPSKFRIDPQKACPLFHLPPEIRNHIFALALLCEPRPLKPLDYRGGQTPRRKNRTATALLRTSRLIHLETALLPASVNTHVFEYPSSAAMSFPIPTYASSYFERMTPAQLAAVRRIHLVVEKDRLRVDPNGDLNSYGFWAEWACMRALTGHQGYQARFARPVPAGIGGPFPEEMTITVSNVGWKARWFSGGKPKYDLDHMMHQRCWKDVLGGVKVLKFQLETVELEKELLLPLVAKLENVVFDLGSGQELAVETKAKERAYEGEISATRDCLGRQFFRAQFCAFEMTWRVRSSR